MNRVPYKALLMLAVITILALAACAAPPAAPAPAAAPTQAPAAATQAPAPAAKPDVYKVGLINHLTGDAAAYGQSMKKGTELALDVINGAGGIGGTKVEVIFEDDRLSAADAQTAFLKLVQSDKVPVVMGSGASSLSLSLCPKAQEMKIVQISSISTAPSLKDCGKYFFSAMASDTAQGPEWVKVAEALGAKEAAVMYINNDYGIGVKDTFVPAFEKAGGKVLIAQPFDAGQQGFPHRGAQGQGDQPQGGLHRRPRGRGQHCHQAGQRVGHGDPVGHRCLNGCQGSDRSGWGGLGRRHGAARRLHGDAGV